MDNKDITAWAKDFYARLKKIETSENAAIEPATIMHELEKAFPELKESEDERIRKLLVWQVYRNIEDETNDLAGSVYDGVKGHDPDLEESIEDWKKCLAYLERQKKQTTKTDACGFPIRDKGESACSYLERCLAPDMRNIWYEACAEIKERQKKQQPAEWSEEDTEMYINVECSLRGYACGLENEGHKKHIKKELDWFENRFKSIRPQPHWKPSEEQIETLEYYMHVLVCNEHKEILFGLYKQLKSLYEIH